MARIIKALVACAAIAAAAVGCGSTASQPTTARHVHPPEAADPRVRGLLQHPTQQPPDVSTQFDYAAGAGPGECDLMTVHAPQVNAVAQPFSTIPYRQKDAHVVRGSFSFGQALDVCFEGFGPGPVNVVVEGPGGWHREGVLHRLPRRYGSGSRWVGYDWVPGIDASWPLGHYTISATRGVLHASTSFSVTPPTETGVRVLGPSTDPGHNELAPGSLATVFLTGFKGARAVRLVVYRGSQWGSTSYFSSASVPIPTSGDVALQLPTGHPPEWTTYVVTARSDGVTLYGAFSVLRTSLYENTVVGSLPGT